MTVGVRHDDLRRRNREMVLTAVRRAGQPSRTEIAARTGLSHSTISAIAADLISEGALIEIRGGEAPTLKRGRPQVAVGLGQGAASVVSMVLSINHLGAALIDYSGRTIVEQTRKPETMTLSREHLLAQTTEIVRDLLARSGNAAPPLARVVLAVQGTTDAAARRLLWSPITPHADVEFGDVLSHEFGVPVAVENDCNMIAVALRWRDPERYARDFMTMLLSRGIGMGMVLRGELFTGTHSSGVEFGHMIHRPDGALCRCGRRGCIEAYAGNYAIWRNAKRLADEEIPSADIGDDEMKALADAARGGDEAARRAFFIAGEALGFGLGSLFALIDPAPVAVVGHGSLAFDLIEGPMRAAISRTAGGEHSGAISFATEPDEMPLIREGCAMRGLTFVDELVSSGSLARALSQSSRMA